MASPVPHAAFWAKVVPFAAWVLLASVLINLFGVVDRYMILHFSRTPAAAALDAVGNYHSSRVVPLLLVSIAAMLSTMITPHLSHDWEAGKHELVAARLRLFLKLFGFVLYAGAVAVLLAAPLLFTVAFRGKFPCGEAVLPWTLMYCTWFGLWLVMQNYLLCAEKARLASAALACGLILNVLLNLVLLPRLGLEGAVLLTAAANVLSLGLTCMFNHRLGFRLDRGAMLVILLPALLCLGPWAALFALLVVAADALWADRLLSPEEKQQVAESVAQYVKRFGFGRLPADSAQRRGPLRSDFKPQHESCDRHNRQNRTGRTRRSENAILAPTPLISAIDRLAADGTSARFVRRGADVPSAAKRTTSTPSITMEGRFAIVSHDPQPPDPWPLTPDSYHVSQPPRTNAVGRSRSVAGDVRDYEHARRRGGNAARGTGPPHGSGAVSAGIVLPEVLRPLGRSAGPRDPGRSPACWPTSTTSPCSGG